MATTLFNVASNSANDAGAQSALGLAGVSTTGIYGFSNTGGTNTLSGALPYNGQPFTRYVASGGPANATTVVDIVFPQGRDHVAASYCLVYTVAAGALT
jgi:hypothetical protein